jgi:hypothetical protein
MKVRTTISVNSSLMDWAGREFPTRDFDSFSSYIEDLLRKAKEEATRTTTAPSVMHDDPTTTRTESLRGKRRSA